MGISWLTPYLLNQIAKKDLSDRKTHQSKWTKLRAYCLIFLCLYLFPRAAFCLGGSDNKASAYNAGDPGSIPESGRSPGEGNGNPLQYSCLEYPMDGGVWQATVHGVANSWTQLSDFTLLYFTLGLYYKVPQTQWPKTTKIYFLTVLEAVRNQGFGRAVLPLKALGENPFPVSSSIW